MDGFGLSALLYLTFGLFFPCFNSLLSHKHLGYLLCGRHGEQKYLEAVKSRPLPSARGTGHKEKNGVIIEIQINNE